MGDQYKRHGEGGFTLVEVVISLTVMAVITIAFFNLFIALVHSTTIAKQRSVAAVLATNQMEYIRSLPYDNLAVSGGSIIASTYLPAKTTKKVNNVTYSITTSISYIDDAYDGCGPYPTLDLKKKYCRSFSAPGNSAGNNQINDTNPADYKIVHISVKNPGGVRLAVADTQIAARVAETASTTGALFVRATDPSGNGLDGVTVTVTNTTVSPQVAVSDTTDGNGMAIFYGLPPDSGPDYIIKAEKVGYSSIQSIAAAGSLQPTYVNQKILSQQASYLALVVGATSSHSLIIETTDTTGAPIANVKTYIKGGYKKYTATSDTSYYYDTLTPTDVRPTTDATGIAVLSNLPPINSYLFCGVDGSSGCVVGGTTYYLASAVPYGGGNSLGPIAVPIVESGQTTFMQDGAAYLQKVRLVLTTNSAFPRVFTANPSTINLSDNLHNVKVVFGGYNLAGASATLKQGDKVYTDPNCVSNATQLTCNYDLSTATEGAIAISVQNASGTLTLPTTPMGGLYVKP